MAMVKIINIAILVMVIMGRLLLMAMLKNAMELAKRVTTMAIQ